jgi:hypothetical protein
MNIRFTESNWARFKLGKETTIRSRLLANGVFNVIGGSRFKPVKRGQVELKLEKVKSISILSDRDARRDGFANVTDLVMELARLNPKLQWNDIVFIYNAKVI